MAQVEKSYAENMKPDNEVDMGSYICTNVAGVKGEPCPLYPKTHKHITKEDK